MTIKEEIIYFEIVHFMIFYGEIIFAYSLSFAKITKQRVSVSALKVTCLPPFLSK